MKMLRIIGAVAACAIGFAGTAQAAFIDLRLDLSNQVGTTSGNWNNISNLNGMTSGLIDFNTGAATGVSITGNSSWSNFFGDDAGAFPNQDWLIQPATKDGAGLQAGLTGTFTFAGLTGSAYKIELVSARTSFGYLNQFTVDGAFADGTYLGSAPVNPWDATTDGLGAGNWLIWDSVTPIGGEIKIMDEAIFGTLGILNAIRISEVPTPGAMALLGLAGLVGTRRRR